MKPWLIVFILCLFNNSLTVSHWRCGTHGQRSFRILKLTAANVWIWITRKCSCDLFEFLFQWWTLCSKFSVWLSCGLQIIYSTRVMGNNHGNNSFAWSKYANLAHYCFVYTCFTFSQNPQIVHDKLGFHLNSPDMWWLIDNMFPVLALASACVTGIAIKWRILRILMLLGKKIQGNCYI